MICMNTYAATNYHMKMFFFLKIDFPFFFFCFSSFSMPNVFSKLVIQDRIISALSLVKNVVGHYAKHRTTIQRSILFILILRSVLSIRQFIKALKKKSPKKDNKKVEVRKIMMIDTDFKGGCDLFQAIVQIITNCDAGLAIKGVLVINYTFWVFKLVVLQIRE